MSILTKVKNLGKGILNKIKELSVSDSDKKLKDLIKNKRTLRAKDFKPGNILFYGYDAKDKEQVYDRTPLVVLLRHNNTHTLGLNLHWVPLSMRINLVKLILIKNEKNIQNKKPLEFSYKDLRPHLKSLGYAPVIRLYINKRITSKGVVLPPSRLLEASRLRTESFTKGKYTAGQLLAKARKSKKK